MGRPISKKCLHCSELSVEEAKEIHGPSGDNCWDPKVCHRRRSHYRHRADVNRVRRRLRRQAKQSGQNEAGDHAASVAQSGGYVELELDPSISVPSAVLVLYRSGRDAPVHAVGAEVWRGNQQIGEVKPTHCMGMRGNQVSEHIRSMLEILRQQFGTTRFEDTIKDLPVHQCPIDPCPLNAQ